MSLIQEHILPLYSFTLWTWVWSDPISVSAVLWRKTNVVVGKRPNLCRRSQKITAAAALNLPSLLRCALPLREDPENELALLMGFKGRGDDDILSRRQAKSLRHFPQVDVSLAFGFGGRVQEKVLLQMLILPTHLETIEEKFKSRESNCLSNRMSVNVSIAVLAYVKATLGPIQSYYNCAVTLPSICTVCWCKDLLLCLYCTDCW